ncbi:hypothetical protein [Cellulomonas massiliensis]|uniref:hypothetical protein n=1 Tax=Cellulomonas massiliensis TaxID=1465811 RepID=UPI0002EAB26E|nr:hypothetical protein [Cellulomonas massiliensis]
MAVKVDKEVLAATVVALEALAEDLPGLFSRASALEARVEMSGLTGADQWATDTSRDLKARIGVLEQMNGATPTFAGLAMNAEQARAIAGQSMSVEDAAVAIRAGAPSADAWEDSDPANLQEWMEQLQTEALRKLAGMDDAETARVLVDAYHDVQDVTIASGAVVSAMTALVVKGGPALASWMIRRNIVAPGLERLATTHPGLANKLSGTLSLLDDYYLRGKTQFTYPGAFVPNTAQKVLLQTASIVEDFDAWVARMSSKVQPYTVPGQAPKPTILARLLQSRAGTSTTTWVSTVLRNVDAGQLAAGAARWGNHVFGRPWTDPVTGRVFGRGAGNLVTMASRSGTGTMLRAAGGLRVLGAVGSGVATVDGAIGLWNNRDENAELWEQGGTEGKAHVVGEYAEVAFNASMTAALIAPNPITWGAVAVTGAVWAGAKVVEHWDDIEKAAGEAVDWAGDRAEEAADWVGDQVDAVKESKLNPMNWF